MYQKLDECPSCKHTLFTNFLICTDHSVSGESFALVSCNKCKLVFTNPRPDERKIIDYYQSDTYISHANRSNNLINIVYKLSRSFTIRLKNNLIKKYKSEGRILDFGCGTGHFIAYMAHKGWDATGYEPNLINNNGSKAKYLDSIEDIKHEDNFHIITAWHVIEHVHELRATLTLLRRKLKKGGYLFIAVPNINSYDATHYKKHWAAYDVPRHLYHFSQASFKSLAANAKLNLVNTIPMKLDAFYVSWLSENYSGTNSPLKAMINGYKSNRLAKKTGEYSSLIYVLKA